MKCALELYLEREEYETKKAEERQKEREHLFYSNTMPFIEELIEKLSKQNVVSFLIDAEQNYLGELNYRYGHLYWSFTGWVDYPFEKDLFLSIMRKLCFSVKMEYKEEKAYSSTKKSVGRVCYYKVTISIDKNKLCI